MNRQSIRTIDLFCGAGGSSYGARMAGAEIVAGFDIWQSAIKTYSNNFPKSRTFEGDLRDMKPEEVKNQIGEIDLILASPECTNHSVAKGAAERCELSKLTAFEVTRYAKVFNPKWIVIENVVEMASWSEHPKLLEELWNLNYFVKELRLNSADFGVPQARNRLFLVCSKAKEVGIPAAQKKHIPVSSIIDWSDKYKYTPLRKPGRGEKTLKKADNAIKELGKDKPFLMVYYGTGDGWQSLDKPLRTITTLDRFALGVPDGNNGHKMRMLQPEELKLAMGFGKDFNLNLDSLSRRERIKLMGNGVCPPVMQEIVSSLIR